MGDSVLEFKVGDVVQLRSGGPAMTLGRFSQDGRYYNHYAEKITKVSLEEEESYLFFGRIYETALPLEALRHVKMTSLLLEHKKSRSLERELTQVKVGSLVRLNSGSDRMTVTNILPGLDNTSDVEVSWFSKDSPCEQFATVPMTSLTLVG